MSKPDALSILFGIESYEITNREGNGLGGRIYFKAISGKPLTNEQVYELQCRLGYSPDGYGSFSKYTANAMGRVVTTWACSASCD